MINISSDDDEGSSWSVSGIGKRGRPRRESTEGSEPPQLVKAFSIPDEYHSKLLVIVLASDGFTPFSLDNPIKMATLINKEFRDVSRTKKAQIRRPFH